VIVNCNELWTRMVHVVYRIRRREVLTPMPPQRTPTSRQSASRR
jgi:hypothetical protein